ncbi:MAG TPA: sodium:proton antiporter [Opitutales bacterium]|jgi:Na+/H+ antiporter NhaD/arsenite permease-like protein|nr:sodium:proton antiporter [Opitutales bacterium]
MYGFIPVLGAVEGVVNVPLAMVAPFGLLLVLIAVMPLTRPTIKQWWEKYYPAVSIGLGVMVAGYYFSHNGGGLVVASTLREYISFICLIGSLYVVAGGIHIQVKGEATPMANVVFLAVGAVLANVIGTTGASMVLIRPWIRMNKIRVSGYHVVFFIFLVSNIGGALTPMGPPLFLGYLAGVPFFWFVNHVIVQWLVTVGAVLVAFYIFDVRSFHRLPRKMEREIETHGETWQFDGMGNVFFLLALVGAVFVPDDMFPAREVVMVAIAGASYFLTKKQIHEKNAFRFEPIKEVAFLFVGIFMTMMPALSYLAVHGQEFGCTHPMQYYIGSGALSAVLDNAPTYLNFLQLAQSTAIGLHPAAFAGAHDSVTAVRTLLEQEPRLVIGASMGSVFFGAMTYIGNGPNFMVKSIAHDAGVHCPTFHRYLTHYSLPVLLPILLICGWLFL